jgi:hypothetical protein
MFKELPYFREFKNLELKYLKYTNFRRVIISEFQKSKIDDSKNLKSLCFEN